MARRLDRRRLAVARAFVGRQQALAAPAVAATGRPAGTYVVVVFGHARLAEKVPLSVVVLDSPCGDAHASFGGVLRARAEPYFVLRKFLLFEAGAVTFAFLDRLPWGALAIGKATAVHLALRAGYRGDGGDGGDGGSGGSSWD